VWEEAVGGQVADADCRKRPVGYSREVDTVADRFESDMKGRHYILLTVGLASPIAEQPVGVLAWPPPVDAEVDAGEGIEQVFAPEYSLGEALGFAHT
jgi:hypothetical protein